MLVGDKAMTFKKFRNTASGVLTIVTVALVVTIMFASRNAAASTYKVLYAFKNLSEGADPRGTLAMDGAGNLYGTTAVGGGFGNVFELTRNTDGTWTETVLHSFSGLDGNAPYAGVTLDADGNLYGTTVYGGAYCLNIGGCGVVFKLTCEAGGTWTESVLFSFKGPHFPQGGVVFDKVGNLYGTTYNGGDTTCEPPKGCGEVFKLAPGRDGAWNYTRIHNFTGSPDGQNPSGGVVFDAVGNLWGTTIYGGLENTAARGTIFELTPNADGTWSESVAHAYTGLFGDGAYPFAGLSIVREEIYVATAYGGELNCFGGRLTLGCGTVQGFDLDGTDGAVPVGTLTADALGNIYGTTASGGDLNCSSPYGCGVAFKLTDGHLTILHTFEGCDGENPYSGLIIDAAGNLYGTVLQGMGEDGLVFEITP
jgi:uncharacterized repeat protein (TIGR03803 family)